MRGRPGGNALMVFAAAGQIELAPVDLLDDDLPLAGLGDQFADGAAALALGDEQRIDGAAAAQRFRHGVPADDQLLSGFVCISQGDTSARARSIYLI